MPAKTCFSAFIPNKKKLSLQTAFFLRFYTYISSYCIALIFLSSAKQ